MQEFTKKVQRFRLTIRNVNIKDIYAKLVREGGFRLTIRNVNHVTFLVFFNESKVLD